jgi:hypothetical protein
MQTFLLAPFVLAALATAALAEPVALTDADMDQVTAGQFNFNNVLTPGTNHVITHEGRATTITVVDPHIRDHDIFAIITPGTELFQPNKGGVEHITEVTAR